jgi:hypothetical protein
VKTVTNPIHFATRCTAHSKRTGLSCGSPAVSGWSVCRTHGVGGGAPPGKLNGNYKHGGRTIETMALRAEIRDLVRESRELLASIE